MRLREYSVVLLSAAGLLWLAPQAQAVDWALCGAGLAIPSRPAIEYQSGIPGAADITADEADIDEDAISLLIGDVQVVRDNQLLEADTVIADKREQTIEGQGRIRLWDDGMFFSGDYAHMTLDTDVKTVEGAKYTVMQAHAHGDGQRLVLTGKDLVVANDATYSTCNPDQMDWTLEARELTLDRVADEGKARHAKIRVRGVPIFYSPYLSFPLSDKRRSGLLFPTFGATESSGFEVRVPYYWNIAPNYDATFTARGMSKRGLLAEGEFRYMTGYGRGEVRGEVLPWDYEDDRTRGAFAIDHRGSFAPRWSTNIDVNWVSDSRYLEDLGTNINITGTSFLRRRADLRYRASRWNALARVDDYQTVDDTVLPRNRPYKRLPQLLFDLPNLERNRQVGLGFDGELVNFDRDSSVTGQRLDLYPEIAFPIRNSAAYFTPRVGVRYTTYNLTGRGAGESENPSRILPIVSADTGVTFERDWGFKGSRFVQTLEPRLFYVYVPFDNQDDLPVFDTSVFTGTFEQLFRTNVFTGPDRVQNANQLTLALTTRLLAPDTGDEILRASIGQIRYFADRKVTLPGGTRQTTSGSDIAASLFANIGDAWRVSGSWLFNPDSSQLNRNTISLRYQPTTQRVVNLSYRNIRDTLNQTDLSFAWPIRHNWSIVGRWAQAWDTESLVEVFGGAEYESCCWATRFVVRRFVTNTEGEFDTGVFLQLELKGLAGVGRRTVDFLKQNIPGYQNAF